MTIRAPKNLSKEFSHVHYADPGIDSEHEDYDYEAYLDTGDLKFLPTKEGAEVTVFQLRRLDEYYTECAGPRIVDNDDKGKWKGVRVGMNMGIKLCLVGANNYPLDFDVDGDGRKMLSEDCLKGLYAAAGSGLVFDLWSRILKISAGELEGK